MIGTPGFDEHGYYGFMINEGPEVKQGYSYYKLHDAGDHQFWVDTMNGSGGTGNFTAVSFVKRINNDTLSVNTLDGGDRCNGGIDEVKEKNHQLEYSAKLTSYDLVILGKHNQHNINAYDDLAACALCCAAVVHYGMDTNLKRTFLFVELDNVKDVGELPDQGKYESCFNKIFVAYVSKGETRLNEAKLKEFVRKFEDACFK